MIDSFRGAYRFLSNFHPCSIVLDGKTYGSTEHAYQAAKTLDPGQREAIRMAKTPGDAKRLGKKVEVRPDWETVRIGVMQDIVRQKFNDPALAKMLLDTNDEVLVEGNYWNDVFWGVCNGVGENHLGKILLSARDEIRKKT